MSSASKKTLLLNHVTWRPVGHVVEALKLAKGYAIANEGLEIHLLLNKRSPFELAEACNWIHQTYPVDTEEVLRKKHSAHIFRKIPNSWDYVLHDVRPYLEYKDGIDPELDLVEYFLCSKQYFKAKIGAGDEWRPWEISESLKYNCVNKVRLKLPKYAQDFVKNYNHNGPKICLLPGGSSSFVDYPSMTSWALIIKALDEALPNLRVYITGVSKSMDGRTSTSEYALNKIKALSSEYHNLEICFDIGLWNQLALIQKCDLLISPHSGFSFLAPFMDTPLLTICGRMGPEYFFNQAPFYSVLPECNQYPCGPWKPFVNRLKALCEANVRDNKRVECMQERSITGRIPEIVKGAKLLLQQDFTFEKALESHIAKIGNLWEFNSPFISDATLMRFKRENK
jgi:hypothetical protein